MWPARDLELVDYTGPCHEFIVSRRSGHWESCKYRFRIFLVACVRTSAKQDFDFGYPHLTKLIKDSSYVCLSTLPRAIIKSNIPHSLGY